MSNTHAANSPSAIILAAGKGTRMKSDLPKVVHPIGGRPMVCAVVDACLAVGCSRIVVIVGYKQEDVRAALKGYDGTYNIEYAVQDQQLGTGHAVQCCAPAFEKTGFAGDTLVLCGDGPLIRPVTLEKVLKRHRDHKASATLATAVLDDASGYGRIYRGADGKFKAIVEQKNCTPEQLAIKEVNPSYYCFNTRDLFSSLKKVTKNPVSGEYYLTDTLSLLLDEKKTVEVIEAVPPEDVLSINTLEDLAKVDAIYRSRPAVQVPAGVHR
ncbi:MAG: NTP transferase domain-containing protein [Phycisphaerales bacterium]|nr:NTP transferase domain-containing protein [Phycisphaerales bacterium]